MNDEQIAEVIEAETELCPIGEAGIVRDLISRGFVHERCRRTPTGPRTQRFVNNAAGLLLLAYWQGEVPPGASRFSLFDSDDTDDPVIKTSDWQAVIDLIEAFGTGGEPRLIRRIRATERTLRGLYDTAQRIGLIVTTEEADRGFFKTHITREY